ncbi:MAG: transglycosylase SLT domain-containing protein [Deltaproteobacteria bacterium]|nr:transglycosylase SLT domain-containing protein [Deltaproteobacteria bacterium]
MLKCCLPAVILGLAGPQCPSSSGTTTPAAETAEAVARPDHDAVGADHAGDATGAVADGAPTPADTLEVAPPVPETAVDRLRRAGEAFDAGRWVEADDGFRALLGSWPALDELLRFRAMESALRAERLDVALADAQLLAAGSGPYAPLARVRKADVAFLQQRWAEALAAYAALPRRLPREADALEVRFRTARCREALGETEQARKVYEQLVREEPGRPAAAAAEERLRAGDPAFVLPAPWRLERARTLVRRREWAAALDELDRIPAAAADPPAADVAWERAQALYLHRRRWDESAAAYAAVAELGGRHAVEAEFLRARSLARDQQDAAAIVAYREFSEKHAGTARATDALYLATTLELYLNRFDDAITALEELVGRNRTGPGRPQSRWSLAFAYYLAGRPADALPLFDGTLGDDDDPYSKPRAQYWGAVARRELGRTDEARALWKTVISEKPLHWYAQLARHRLAELGDEPPPPYPERGVGRSDLVERCGELPAEVEVLRSAGLVAEARTRLLAELGPRVAAATGDELRELCGRLLCVDAAEVPYRHVAVAHLYDWGLALDAEHLPYWEAAYPRAWRDDVEAAAATHGMSPYLVWAIMRQESSFDPDVVSTAKAIGLLQMIPPTTRRILEARGEAYDDRVLFDPARNLALGTEYIAWIGRKFHGQVPLQAAGFNGGPHNVARWLRDFHETRLDVFVERIPFDQTRNYVRRVVTSYARYLYLYESDENAWPLELPCTLRTDFLPDPDF